MTHSSFDGEETLAGAQTLLTRDAADSGAPFGPPPSLSPGISIGRYVVLQRVGRGGMGVVYAAYDPELDRKVALKVLMPRGGGQADDAGQRRLMREAQAMAQVSHPHVVAVHDVGIHAGQVFMAMEFIDGPTLRGWIDAEARTPRQILEVFAQAGRGLAAAHAKGLVHRDFKPDNVMVGRDDGSGTPRALVMDFGLVRALADAEDRPPAASDATVAADAETSDEPLTRMGQLLGTPAFMAPEQFSHQKVDARTDQFAFCVALWSALFGQPPFIAEGLPELAGRVLSGQLDAPPSTSSVEPRVRRILERGLRVEQDERWPSMDALLRELLRDPTRSRRRVLVTVALLGGVALALGAQRLQHTRALRACDEAVSAIDEVWNDDARERMRQGLLATGSSRAADVHDRTVPWIDRYVEHWRQARRSACVAASIEERWNETTAANSLQCLTRQRGTLETLLTSAADANLDFLDGLVMKAATLRSPKRCIDENILASSPPLMADPEGFVERTNINEQIAKVQHLTDLSHLPEAFALIEQLRPQVQAMGSAPLQLTLLHREAKAHERAENLDEAKACYRDALALALEHGALDYAADILLGLASTHLRRSELDDGLWATEMATALYRRSGEPEDSALLIDVLHMQAWLEHGSGYLDRALADAQQALELRETYQGVDHPAMSDELCLVAMIQSSRNALAESEALARRCVEQRESTLGPDDPDVAAALQQLGDVLRAAGRREDSIAAFERAVSILRKTRPEHQALGSALGNLGMALNQAGRVAEAERVIVEGTAILEAALGPESLEVGLHLVNVGNVRQNLGAHEAARDAYLRALKIMDDHPGAARMARPVALSNLANAEYLLDRFDDAVAHNEEALALTEEIYGPEHPHVADILGNLASLHRTRGRPEQALELFARALAIGERALGPDHADLAYTLTGLATTLLDLDRSAEALPLAERALALRGPAEVSAIERATAQWTVALALRANGRDPARATALAQQALVAFEQIPFNETQDKIRAFLAER